MLRDPNSKDMATAVCLILLKKPQTRFLAKPTRKSDIGILYNLKETLLTKSNTDFCYSNIEDFDKVVVTCLCQMRSY